MSTPDVIALDRDAVTAMPRRGRGGPARLVLQRLVLGVFVLLAVSVVVFAATQALPGDPAQAILGTNATPERLANLREELDLERPLLAQYTGWLGGVLTGDLGTSYAAREPVADLVGSRVVNSMALLMFAALIGIPTGILLGAYSAVRRDTRFDELALLAAFGLAALPEFVVGMVLVIVFATTVFQVLPGVALIPSGETPFSHLDALVLPVATLALAVIPYLFRLVRASMIDVLESDYVQMARLKGMPERNVLLRHALPNALVPAIQASALVLAYLAGGIVVVEFLFAYPGLGSGLTDAIANRDLPMIQVSVLILATGVVIFNLVADLLTIYMTPRLRTSGS